MSCYSCLHSKMLENPINYGEYSVFGYCYKDGENQKHPIYLPDGSCKYKKAKENDVKPTEEEVLGLGQIKFSF